MRLRRAIRASSHFGIDSGWCVAAQLTGTHFAVQTMFGKCHSMVRERTYALDELT
jgi:hypothetical protein